MPWRRVKPETFLRYGGVTIFHAYKDDFSDTPLEFWYSTSSAGEYESPCEFDVRSLPEYNPAGGEEEILVHKRVIKAAIDAGFLRVDEPLANA